MGDRDARGRLKFPLGVIITINFPIRERREGRQGKEGRHVCVQ